MNTHLSKTKSILLTRLIPLLGMTLCAGTASAAVIGSHLDNLLTTADVDQPLEIIISYNYDGPVSNLDLAELQAVGVNTGVYFESLPVVGAMATPAQIDAVAADPDVLSIFLNRPLEFFNQASREISGVAKAQAQPSDFNKVLPYSGSGVTAMVNDSGIDATHKDLTFGNHVVENVQAVTNLAAIDGMLPITYIEGQANTDTNSGHGTHVAGTFGGNGAQSSGLYAGVAPGADIVGYGSGGVLFILDGLGGFDYAITHQFSFDAPIRIITNSWGSSGDFEPTDPINLASYAAFKRGISVLFAAGNSGSGEDTHNPYAQAPWVISVAAATKQGQLIDFSSRGLRGESGNFTTPDGREWTYVNEPTIAATGVDVISTRAVTNLSANGGEGDVDVIAPAHLPYYTMISGTSMATPHAAGIVALIYEANPDLDPLAVKDLLQQTATNMPGRDTWEVGAGHANAYAALVSASGIREDFGDTVKMLRDFHANALLQSGGEADYSLFFSPVGGTDVVEFDISADTAWISASATVGTNTVALLLTSPDGTRYGSSISLPVIGEQIGVAAPAMPGTWQLTVRGIGSISGNAVDPLSLTDGYAVPGYVDTTVRLLNTAGYTGLNDVAGHPAENAIQVAVQRRLMDGFSDGAFKPDADLKRRELAESLTMGAAIRQSLPLDGGYSYQDVRLNDAFYAMVEAVTAPGGALKDRDQNDSPVMQAEGSRFHAKQSVNRADLAYSLVQSLALQNEADSFSGEVTVDYNGETLLIEDQDQIPAHLRGYVQLAINLDLIPVRFSLSQGQFDLQPTLHANFAPQDSVARGEFAVYISRFSEQWLK